MIEKKELPNVDGNIIGATSLSDMLQIIMNKILYFFKLRFLFLSTS